MTHNGYTNADTYHVAATIDNVEPLYRAARERPTERGIWLVYANNTKLFPTDINQSAVNWQELAGRYNTNESE